MRPYLKRIAQLHYKRSVMKQQLTAREQQEWVDRLEESTIGAMCNE